MDELVGLLTRERLLLDRVLFRATGLRLVLGGDPRFIAWASADLTKASDALRDAELRRALVWSELAARTGWDEDGFDWDLLLGSSEEPYTTILRELKEGLAISTIELRNQLDAIRTMGSAGLTGVGEMLERLASPGDLVRPGSGSPLGPGTPWQPAAGISRVDQTL